MEELFDHLAGEAREKLIEKYAEAIGATIHTNRHGILITLREGPIDYTMTIYPTSDIHHSFRLLHLTFSSLKFEAMVESCKS